MIIIPAIDIYEGKVVRLLKGNFNKPTYYSGSPLDYINYFNKCGIKRVHIVDLNGAKDGSKINYDIIDEIVKNSHVNIQIGGGIRSIKRVEELFNLGVKYIILGTLSIKDVKQTIKIIERFPKKIILSLDAYNEIVLSNGWQKQTKLTIDDFLNIYNNLPVESIIYTDVSRDGTLEGYNITSLKEVCTKSNIPIIASGGFSCASDICKVKDIKNLKGIIIGKALYEEKIDLKNIVNIIKDEQNY
ncbi:MAG: 1-(5-phosphoribosyl)-5-[(5-phosphoribosylamino)methylideneamino]imidazole-4-carboxamide isomerase [Deferribacterota bacterium]|nr:1-(5-phosphoribosyl)-5-[(5-phosphoribosylamino)methylideneamino]imidazole-4-carboxamide isomerase [Deferribacterota bacterium]